MIGVMNKIHKKRQENKIGTYSPTRGLKEGNLVNSGHYDKIPCKLGLLNNRHLVLIILEALHNQGAYRFGSS